MTITQKDATWMLLSREAALSTRLLESGLTDIRHAYFGLPAAYYEAFFSLSVGLERVAKLVIAVCRYIKSGSFPADREMRQTYGHDLVLLFSALNDLEAHGEVDYGAERIAKRDQLALDERRRGASRLLFADDDGTPRRTTPPKERCRVVCPTH
ncbi:MAG: hypothetical protein LBE83_04435 [Propionibacteriaceae bacterium]|jgi:hypothetical protein|nr:hypothetical protein [Propionibacteriaceae bacterium]